MTVKPIKFGTGRQLTDHAYVQTLADFFSHYDQVPHIQTKIKTAQQVVTDINDGYLPPRISDITITEEDVAILQGAVLDKYPNSPEKGNKYWQELIEPLESLDEMLASLRDVLMSDYDMYNYANNEFVSKLSEYIGDRPVLEIMAGQGYITAGLRALNTRRTMIATDNQSWISQPGEHIEPVTEVINMDALKALQRYAMDVDLIVMSWAPDTDDIDWQVLSWLRNNALEVQLIVIGELNGATNSERFWREATLIELEDLNESLKSFDLIDEKVYIAR